MKSHFLYQGLLLAGGGYVARAVQTTYSENMRVAVPGQLARMSPVDLISRNVEDVAGIGFGIVVQQGVRDDGCTADLTTVAMTADRFLGITVRERSVRPETPNGFAQYESARIIRKGPIWVMTGGAVNAGDDVTVTLASGLLGTAAVGAGIIAIPRARWETSTAGAALAVLQLN
jgi:hypothetical protein